MQIGFENQIRLKLSKLDIKKIVSMRQGAWQCSFVLITHKTKWRWEIIVSAIYFFLHLQNSALICFRFVIKIKHGIWIVDSYNNPIIR